MTDFMPLLIFLVLGIIVLLVIVLSQLSSLRKEVESLRYRELRDVPALQASYTPQPTPRQAPQPTVQPASQPAPQPTPLPTSRQAPQPTSQPAFSMPSQRRQQSVETTIGRNIIAIIASVLVFLGLVFLGFLTVPYLTDGIKVAAMFVLSFALSALGFGLSMRKKDGKSAKNAFTVTLLGCGLGAVFISILVTHLYFGMLNEIAAYLILLVWTALAMVVAKVVDSLSVSIVAHIGTAFSICAGYLGAVEESMVLLLLGYQTAACAVVIVGNTLWSKRTRVVGLYVSLALTIFVSLVALARSPYATRLAAADSPDIYLAIFLAQFVLACVFAALLLQSASRLSSKSRFATVLITTLVWVLQLALAFGPALYRLIFANTRFNPSSTFMSAAWITVALALVAVLIGMRYLNAKEVSVGTKRALALSVFGYSIATLVVAHFVGSWIAVVPDSALVGSVDKLPLEQFSWLLLLAIFVVLVQKLTKDSFYTWVALCALCLDSLFANISSYAELATLGGNAALGALSGFAYLAVQVVVLYALYRVQSNFATTSGQVAVKIAAALVVQFGIFTLLACVKLPVLVVGNGTSLALLATAALFIIVHRLHFERVRVGEPEVSALYKFLRIDEFVVFILGGLWLLARHEPAMIELLIILAFASLAIAQCVVRILDRNHHQAAFDLFSAIAATFVVLGAVGALTDWYDEAYTVSLIVILIAFASIAAGFWQRIGVLRIYGLVLVCLGVFKLLTFDLGDVNSFMRVAAFIGSGVLCFGISALYSFAVKRLNQHQEPLPPPDSTQ